MRDTMPEIGAFVALGDSFTEGLGDPYPGRDRATVATGLSRLGGQVRRAARRRPPGPALREPRGAGKWSGQVAADQVPLAIAMAPDLVSIAAGGNDLLRPRADPDALGRRRSRRSSRTCGRPACRGAGVHRVRPAHVPADPADPRQGCRLQHAPARDRRPPRLPPGGPMVDAGARRPARVEPGPAAPEPGRPPPGGPAGLRGHGREHGRRTGASRCRRGSARKPRWPGPSAGWRRGGWTRAGPGSTPCPGSAGGCAASPRATASRPSAPSCCRCNEPGAGRRRWRTRGVTEGTSTLGLWAHPGWLAPSAASR